MRLPCLGWPSSEKAIDNILDHFASMQSHRPAGEVLEYTSINTIILSLLVERITGKTYTDFLEHEIWQRMGAESDALSLITPEGEAVSPLSISSTLRDLARYGLLFTPTGRNGSNKVISDAFLEKIQKKGRPEIFASSDFPYRLNGELPSHNTYQWDFVMKDGDFFKGAAAGQGLYISPERDLVIAFFGQGNHELSHITRQLVKSGLFDK